MKDEVDALNEHADELNREAEDVLEFQGEWIDAEDSEVQPEWSRD